MVTSARTICLNAELKIKENLLKLNYQAQAASVNSKQVKLLEQAQKNWIAFRNAWCEVEASSSAEPGQQLNKLFCMIDLTSDQAQKLKELNLK